MLSRSPSRQRVVVTGHGMITPLGRNTAETFERARRGLSGVDYITSFDTRGLPCRIGGQVKDAWLNEVLDPPAQRFYKFSSRGLQLMRMAALEATGQARLEEITNRDRVGVAFGFHGDSPAVEDILFLHRFYDGEGAWDLKGLTHTGGYSPLNFLRRKPDVSTAILSLLCQCRGPSLSVVSACAAGAQAIGEASGLIRDGRADVMIAGGSEAPLTLLGFVGFVLIRALAERYPSPQKASRPFDRKRNGFVMSEGAGVVVLEELRHALSRGAPILGEMLGYGASADAYRITDVHPKGLGAAVAMRGALEDAGLEPCQVDYINAHGTSTIQNDIAETTAIKQVFGEQAKEIPISSNKSMLGHAIAAAGAIESILTLVGMNRSLLLPTINYEWPDPKCDLDYVPNEARNKEQRVALSNSFGFGGQNACLCLGRFHG